LQKQWQSNGDRKIWKRRLKYLHLHKTIDKMEEEVNNDKIDGDNLSKEVSTWLRIRELIDNPFPQSNVYERWHVNKEMVKKDLKFTISTVKDIENKQ